VKSSLSIKFASADEQKYSKHRRVWEDAQPTSPGAIGRIFVQPSIGDFADGRKVAVPVEPEFVEYLRSRGFRFTLQRDGIDVESKRAAQGAAS
jgi:hypothetical protein